ncbi:hypothetical protein PG994_010246 [Apiospora phragmitis]|uniref:Zn(2)-C6 fungal-type domain-containing protein n=1 Tax=Apiospora phragmitis TaxID=2905665 RepID=A0ABR1TRL0_9PEZI
MDSSASQQRKTGPRACLTCAKAKARCIPCNNPLKCERCDRLQKQCVKQIPARPKERREARIARTAESSRAPVVTSPQMEPACLPARKIGPCGERMRHGILVMFPEDVSKQSANEEDGNASSEWPPWNKELATDTSQPVEATTVPTTAPNAWPRGEEAEKLLGHYRNNMMHLFPFVIVPPHMSAAQLYSERPVLWKAVMLQACFFEGSRQVYMGRKLLQELSEALLTKSRKGLDVLQGLLVSLCSEYIPGYQSLRPRALAMYQSRLQREQDGDGATDYGYVQLDQMRAFADTYYLSTYAFLTSKRPDALGNTAYLQVVSRIIGAKAEYPTDAMLVRLLEIQQIAHSISLAFADGSNSLMNLHFSTLPLIMIFKGFKAQVENFKSKLPVGYLDENGKDTNPILVSKAPLKAHVQVTEILLYEVGMQENLCAAGNLSCIDRIELLWALLRTCQAFLALRLEAMPQFAPRFLSIASYDFMYGFITCLKLTNLGGVPGWDLGHVRRDLRLGDLIEQLTGQMQSVVARRKEGGFHYWSPEEDPYRRLVDLLHGLRGLLASTTTTEPLLPQHQQRDQQKQQQQRAREEEEEQEMEDIARIPTPPSQDTVLETTFNESFGVAAATAAVAGGASTEEFMGGVTWEEAWSDMVFSVDDWGQSTSFAHNPPLPFGFLPC